MSPWTILEWVASVGLSVVLVVAVIFGVAIGVRWLVNVTSGKFWLRKTVPTSSAASTSLATELASRAKASAALKAKASAANKK